MLEDGYSLLLGDDSLRSFWRALVDEQPFSLSRCEGMTFAMEWSSDCYENPVDGQTYVAAQGWREFQPYGQGANGRERVILLNSDDGLRAAVSSEQLGAYISSLFGELAELRARGSTRRTVHVQCTLIPAGSPSLSTKCEPDGQLADDLVARLVNVPGPTVRRKIGFVLTMDLGSDS
jgi:hypothetical protein